MHLRSIPVIWALVFFLLPTSYIYSNSNGTPPFADSYLEARQIAIKEDKPYIIFFTKKGCAPCLSFQKNSVQEDEVLDKLKSYVSVFVDIDDFDGYGLMKYYKINTLPTIMVFTPSGQELKRVDYGLEAAEFKKLLKDPATYHNTSSSRESSTGMSPTPFHSTKKLNSFSDQNHKSDLESLPIGADIYTVQVGVFSSKDNAARLVAKIERLGLKAYYKEEVKDRYKVYSGEWKDKAAALRHKDHLKDYGYSGFITNIRKTTQL